MIRPHDCIYKDFESSWYKRWDKIIHFPSVTHAKFWEMAAIAEALKSRGMLKPGTKGLGFGVGREQLVSAFASFGAEIVATDQNPDSERSQRWTNGQLAAGKESLFYPEIIDHESFDRLVSFQHHDMNRLEKSFVGDFDFCWSNCVIGHLGSTAKSMKFVERHAQYLKLGGYSVFTTELNISSLTSTISDHSDTVVFLLSEIYEMIERAAKVGLQAERFSLQLGNTKQDLTINFGSTRVHREGYGVFKELLAAKNRDAFIKIPFSNYAITQIVLVFKKTKRPNIGARLLQAHNWDLRLNTFKLKQHATKNILLSDYYQQYPPNVQALTQLQATRPFSRLRMKKGESRLIKVVFTNKSPFVFSDLSENHPFNLPPLVVATANPINRASVFHDNSWFSENRPTVKFAGTSAAHQQTPADHRLSPEGTVTYTFALQAPRKAGKYTEDFCLVAESCTDFANTSFVSFEIIVS